jgi:hypothetical protein
VNVRIRVPGERVMQRVQVNGMAWDDFDAKQNIVILPPKLNGRVSIEVSY